MSNMPDGLRAQDDPASDVDPLTVICDRPGCMNSVTVDTESKNLELESTGGCTCPCCSNVNDNWGWSGQ